MIWRKFKAVGSEIVISADLAPEQETILDNAESFILDFEKRFSRFIKGNELYGFNHGKGKEHQVSLMMMELLIVSLELYYETGGIFDPTIIKSLKSVGYGKSFEKISQRTVARRSSPDVNKILDNHYKRARMESLVVIGDRAVAPANFQIDLGGIGKGFLVDHLAEKLFKDVENFWISAGGDLIAKGNSDNAKGFLIGVQNPNLPEAEIFKINTKGEKIAVATSGVIKRKGSRGGLEWVHIIDPRIGLPVKNDILSVTVVTSKTVRADVYAKTVLILGEEEGLKFIENKTESACVIFFKEKEAVFSKRMKQWIEE